jgi:hypothetical protein
MKLPRILPLITLLFSLQLYAMDTMDGSKENAQRKSINQNLYGDENINLFISLIASQPPSSLDNQPYESNEQSFHANLNVSDIPTCFFNASEKCELEPLFNEWRTTTISSLEESKDIKPYNKGFSGAEVFVTKKQSKPYVFKVLEGDNDNAHKEFVSTLEAWRCFNKKKTEHIETMEDESGINLSRLVGLVRPNLFLRKRNPYVLIFERAPGDPVHTFFSDFLRTLKVTDLKDLIEDVAKQMATFHRIMRPKKKDGTLIPEHDKQQIHKAEKVEGSNSEQDNTLIRRDFQWVLKLFSEEYRHHFVDDQLAQITTVTHGDAHSENIFYDRISHKVTFIDYGKMSETQKGFGNPCQDIGRFLGSLWFSAAKKYIGNFHKEDINEAFLAVKGLKELEDIFINSYLDKFFYLNSELDKNAIRRLILAGTELYKREFFATKLDPARNDVEYLRSFLGTLYFLQCCTEDLVFQCVTGTKGLVGRCLNGDSATGTVEVSKTYLYRETFHEHKNYHWMMVPHMKKGKLVFAIKRTTPQDMMLGEAQYLTINDEGKKVLQAVADFWEITPYCQIIGAFKINLFNQSNPTEKGLPLCAKGGSGGIPIAGDHWRIIPWKFFGWGRKQKEPASNAVDPQFVQCIMSVQINQPELTPHSAKRLCNRDVIFELCSLSRDIDPKYLHGNSYEGSLIIDHNEILAKTTTHHRGYHWKILQWGHNTFQIKRMAVSNTIGRRTKLGVDDKGKVILTAHQSLNTLWQLQPHSPKQGLYTIKPYSDPFNKQSLDAKIYDNQGGALILSKPKVEVLWRIRTWKSFNNLHHETPF